VATAELADEERGHRGTELVFGAFVGRPAEVQQRRQRRRQRPEQGTRGTRRLGEPGDQRGAADRVQPVGAVQILLDRGPQRGYRRRITRDARGAQGHGALGLGDVQELVDQPGLADAERTVEHGERAAAGTRAAPQPGQLAEFVLPTGQRRP
jgi:hypothetical protein